MLAKNLVDEVNYLSNFNVIKLNFRWSNLFSNMDFLLNKLLHWQLILVNASVSHLAPILTF